MNARITPEHFDRIYLEDVIPALERDPELGFQAKDETKEYLNKGVCPSCGKRSVFVKKEKPYQLKCNRLNNCGYEERTRDRYQHLFENLSERFPSTPENPNATADAYLSRARGFDISKLQGWYAQGRRQMKPSGEWADTVRFPLCDGYWERIIDARAIAGNEDQKAGIKAGMKYTNSGWVPPGQTIEKHDRVYIVEGIFHAIALHLAGFKAIAAISCVNFPWDIVEANEGKMVTWVVALDDDKAGRTYIRKHLKQLRAMKEIGWVALAGELDWDDVYRDGKLDQVFIEDACYRGRLFTAESARKLAYLVYLRRPAGFYLIEFNNQLFSVRVNQAELTKALDDQKLEGNRDIFYGASRVEQVSNCVPDLDYLEKDVITGEQRYHFSFAFPDQSRNCQAALSSGSIADPRGFVKGMLDFTPGGNFEGGARELAWLKAKWLNDEYRPVRTVRSLPFLGYDEETGTYCFPEFGFQNGRELQVNSHGFIEVKGRGIKTALATVKFERGEDFDPSWFRDFVDVTGMNGLGALAWWTASLFVQQIASQQASFGFLELSGEPGSGKSMLLRLLWRLLGRENTEGIKPSGSGASAVGLLRSFAEVSNLPLVLIESDRTYIDAQGRTVTIQFTWDDVKPMFDYHAQLRVTGAKTTGNEKRVDLWRGALAIAQNASVTGDEATLSRIVHFHFTKDGHSLALKPKAERLTDSTDLRTLMRLAEATESGGQLKTYRIVNDTAAAIGMRQVQFSDGVSAREDDSLRGWRIQFTLTEKLSNPERVEKRRAANAVGTQSAPGQAVSGSTTGAGSDGTTGGQELSGFEATLKKLDDYLGGKS